MWLQRINILLACFLLAASAAEAQTLSARVRDTCVIGWAANAEPDLAGYRAWSSIGGVDSAIYTVTPTGSPAITCANVGITADGVYTFNVVAFDSSNNASSPTIATITRSTVRPRINPTHMFRRASYSPNQEGVTQ